MDTTAYQRLIDIGRALSAEKNIDSLLERILREAKSMVRADAGTLYLTTPRHTLKFAILLNDTLEIAQGGNSGNPVTLPEIPLVADGEANLRNIATRAANLGATINIADVYDVAEIDATGTRKFDVMTGYRSKSFLTVPLKDSRDEVIGVLQLLNAQDASGAIVPFDPGSEPLIEALASQASVALQNRRLLDEQEELKRQLEHEVDERTRELRAALSKLSEAHVILKELTTIDAVTGIRNRQYFEDVLDQEWRRAVRQGYSLSVLLLDIDHFKKVNDTYGHLAGDECLAMVAREVNSLFNRPSDVVARYGGEEFVVILPYVEYERAMTMAEQVRQRIAEREFKADCHQVRVTISIGVATTIPTDRDAPKSLIGAADGALYEAKAAGRDRVMGTGGTIEG